MAGHRREHLPPPLITDVPGLDERGDQLRAKFARLIGVGGPRIGRAHEGPFNSSAKAAEIGSPVWCS